jgi:hypothetical protein
MEPSTPSGFGLRVLEVEADALDEWLVGLLEDLDAPETDFTAVTDPSAADPFDGLPPPH